MTSNERERCSFCGRDQTHDSERTRGIIGATICNDCVWNIAESLAKRPMQPRESAIDPMRLTPTKPALENLATVISVGRVQTQQDVSVMLLSLEFYADGFVVNGRIFGNRDGEDDATVTWFLVMDSQSQLSVSDDRDSQYPSLGREGSGSNQRFRFSESFVQVVNPMANELRIELSDLRWVRFDRHAPGDRSGDVLVPGPWSFSVSLSSPLGSPDQ